MTIEELKKELKENFHPYFFNYLDNYIQIFKEIIDDPNISFDDFRLYDYRCRCFANIKRIVKEINDNR